MKENNESNRENDEEDVEHRQTPQPGQEQLVKQ
jgi:hypothetical protein